MNVISNLHMRNMVGYWAMRETFSDLELQSYVHEKANVIEIMDMEETIYIYNIKLYLYTDKSGTAAPFTGVYTHYDKKKIH